MDIARQLVIIPEKKVVGFNTRTSNEIEMAAGPKGNIATLWQQFFKQNLKDTLANKLSDHVYAIYTQYESDHTGQYSLIIGHEVIDFTNAPDGTLPIIVAPGNFLKFTAPDNSPASVLALWQHIWNFFANFKDFKRTYAADFELYDFARSKQLEIYIAVERVSS
jgi:predicted transcriptional regulator YdeE